MRKISIIALLLFSFTVTVKAQNYQTALNLFLKNERQEAKKQLVNIESGSKDYLEAQLLLTMAYLEDGHKDSSFYSFRNFYLQHPNPYPYAYGLWGKDLFFPDKPKALNDVKDFMQKIADNPKTPVTLKSMATIYLANNSMLANKTSESRKQYAQLNDIKNWATAVSYTHLTLPTKA